MKKNNNSF